MQVRSMSQEDSLEEAMVIHSSILAWRIPWTEEPGGLQSTELQRAGLSEVTEHACMNPPMPTALPNSISSCESPHGMRLSML